MDELAAILSRSDWAVAMGYATATVGGVLISKVCLARRRDTPRDGDVQRAAHWYRQMYGANAVMVVGDHILGASFAPDRRHVAFLRLVATRLVQEVITPEDRARAVDHQGP